MISVHHFPANYPFSIAYKKFKKKMNCRFFRLDTMLRKAKRITLMVYGCYNTDQIVSFIERFLKLYDFDYLCFISVTDSNQESIRVRRMNKVDIYEVSFNDKSDGLTEAWLGNTFYWDNMLKHISLNWYFAIKMQLLNFYCKIAEAL